MQTEQMTLTDFLLARIDEDEAWDAAHAEFSDGSTPAWVPPFWTRVRAESEAKRQIIEEHLPTDYDDDCFTCSDKGDVAVEKFPCPTLRILATVYADHPDYRDEWRP